MTVQNSLITFITLFITMCCFSQKKSLKTQFTNDKIVIDGKFDEPSWQTAEIATDFVMIIPDNGKAIAKEKATEVKVLYDNTAIYISATLYDDEPSKIRKELTLRDNFATAEHFGIFINGYNDGQQEFRFFVSSAGVQQDLLYTESFGEDLSFNAIWDSKVLITSYGWVVEMKIPYAALRFPSDAKQTWGLNFYREIQRDRQQYTWNLIDNKIGSESNQAGTLDGIENIDPPTRLFLIPYSSFYLSGKEGQKTQGELKGGLDIKYGINDAFTLDAILVPDFGQTAFDNVELNLGPFEQQFSENRPFFTEGTDLFSKGDLVYSRRIGGSPSRSATLSTDEIYIENPTKINLLNAVKVSGRTRSGLGIGFLNAVTDKTYAEINNTVTGQNRREIVEPLANYNVFVLDQRFRKNSSVSLINTNVTRDAHSRDANVTAGLFDLNTKKNTYNLSGDFKYSYVNEFANATDKKGYNTSIYAAETSGRFRVGGGAQYVSKEWDNNDLGINFQTHYHSLYSNASYRTLNPTKHFNSYTHTLNLYSEFDNRTGRLQSAEAKVQSNFTTRKNDYYNFGFATRPYEIYDFYEPRSENEIRYVTMPEYISFFTTFSSNYNRKFAIDINPTYSFVNEKDRRNYGLLVSPRYRFSDKLSMIYQFNFSRQNNNIGYVDTEIATDDIIFARRNRITYTNTLTGKYTVNNVMNFNLSVRHYWSYVVNTDYLTLQNDGSLEGNPTYNINKNSNLNTWNMDFSYSWWFAPGSQISVLYRNNASIFQREFDRNISENFRNSINHDNLDHIFSISIRYFIDYNSLKR